MTFTLIFYLLCRLKAPRGYRRLLGCYCMSNEKEKRTNRYPLRNKVNTDQSNEKVMSDRENFLELQHGDDRPTTVRDKIKFPLPTQKVVLKSLQSC